MNAIVAGKQEKQSGGLVFKKQRDLVGSWASGAQQSLTQDEYNNSCLYCEDMAGHVYMVSLKSLYATDAQSSSKSRMLAYLANNTENTKFYFMVQTNVAGYSTPVLYTDSGYSQVGGTGVFLKQYCIGTLEST